MKKRTRGIFSCVHGLVPVVGLVGSSVVEVGIVGACVGEGVVAVGANPADLLGVGEGAGTAVTVEVEVGDGVEVGVGDGVEVGVGVVDGRLLPGEGNSLSTKSEALLVSIPAGRLSRECPSRTSLHEGNITVVSLPYESASIILPLGSVRMRRSPSFPSPFPILPSLMKVIIPLKSGKFV
jgi:hypothetical protein